MLGAIAGDIIGSRYERFNVKNKRFPLFSESSTFTDDTVMTCAIGKALAKYKRSGCNGNLSVLFTKNMQNLGRLYPNAGYGGMFFRWLYSVNPMPYNSFGNGSAMRVSSVGWLVSSLENAERIAKISAEVTHNHPEGIKGAQAVAGAIFLARQRVDKCEIKKYITDRYYALDFTIDEIRPSYEFDVTCQGSIPQAIQAFLESDGYEDAVRSAISIGGDSDTIAAICGGIAEAYYGIPQEIRKQALEHLDERLRTIALDIISLY